jgi:FAD/FMN-containing dehydrogenase
MVDWCRSNRVPFALCSGGHCYEGFSQSSSVVIDTRLMRAVTVDARTMTATAGAGASLGDLYRAIAPDKLAFPAGSCPTVGLAGHVLGGGYGQLARPFGLACDSMLSVDLVDPQGRGIHADAQQNADLFWACRGGGGGSFGVATGFRLQLHRLANVLVFAIDWPQLTAANAAKIMKDWQAWAPHAPSPINAVMQIKRGSQGGISLHCSGQSVGSIEQLRRALKTLSASPQIRTMSYFAAVNYFAGGAAGWTYSSAPMKGKSDYAASPLTDDGLATLLSQIAGKPKIYVLCDSYGGAVAEPKPDATAFPHRGMLFSLQYGAERIEERDIPQRLRDLDELYAAMRPHVSGAAYVNYCDLDLADWPTAYWGQNLARLRAIKAAFDPGNVFRHAQSVPPA